MGQTGAFQQESVHTASGKRRQQFSQIDFAPRVERGCRPELPGKVRRLRVGTFVAGQRCRQQQVNPVLPRNSHHSARQLSRSSPEAGADGLFELSLVIQIHGTLSL
jgi:hypothetical protein